MENISLQLNKAKNDEIKMNRKILSSVIETIIVCGRQEISLRGHRDSGVILLNTPHENDGNFRSLLRYRMNGGDEMLIEHLKKTKTRRISPQIQNELIEICGKLILSKTVMKIQQAEHYM